MGLLTPAVLRASMILGPANPRRCLCSGLRSDLFVYTQYKPCCEKKPLHEGGVHMAKLPSGEKDKVSFLISVQSAEIVQILTKKWKCFVRIFEKSKKYLVIIHRQKFAHKVLPPEIPPSTYYNL